MRSKLFALVGASFLMAACATQEAPKPAPPPVTPVPAPAPAAAPAPAPAPAPAAPAAREVPKPVAEKARIATQVLFDFDRATIRTDGRTALDDIASRARAVNVEVVIVIGHADRIGRDDYNRRLSIRRAEAIKAYLVSKGLQPNRVYAEGKGEAQPVTGDRCRNMGAENRGNAKLIACLQPDRRVEIEILGTRSP